MSAKSAPGELTASDLISAAFWIEVGVREDRRFYGQATTLSQEIRDEAEASILEREALARRLMQAATKPSR